MNPIFRYKYCDVFGGRRRHNVVVAFKLLVQITAAGKLRHACDSWGLQWNQDVQPQLRRDGHLPGRERSDHSQQVRGLWFNKL